MEYETQLKHRRLLPVAILASSILVAGVWVYGSKNKTAVAPQGGALSAEDIEKKVLPPQGVELPVRWGDLGFKMVEAGVIDGAKFEKLYANRGLTEETKTLLYGNNNGKLSITSENSGTILNLLWALGLGTKNDILDTGPMMDARYGGAGGFASTGGWTIAKGEAMDHYSRHSFIALGNEQQELVERVAKNIYRPCCGNSTYFPDCNHGMAMLGLLELMASQGASEQEMYRAALEVNSYWFPDTYLAIAYYLNAKGIQWEQASPKEILGYDFSSAAGYQRILSRVTLPERQSGGGCGI